MNSVLSKSPFSQAHRAAKKFEAHATSLVVVLSFLVYGVKADFPCKTQQIYWFESPGRRYKCLECPDCPEGLQPSVPCGSSVAFGTPIHCVSCQLGKTYSDKYGKAQCQACTVCSKGKAIEKNCSIFSNTECDDKCAGGFYPAPFIFDCFPCAKYCGDVKDELAQECASYEKKCKVRSTPCTNVSIKASDITMHTLKRLSPTKPLKTSNATKGKRRSPTTTQKTASPSHETQPVKPQNELTVMFKTHYTKTSPTSSVPSTWSVANNRKAVESLEIASGEKNSENKTLTTLSTVFASITLVLIIGLIVYKVRRRRTNLLANNAAAVERPTEPDLGAPPAQRQMNPTYTSLEQLENENQELFDWMCLRLDNGRCGSDVTTSA